MKYQALSRWFFSIVYGILLLFATFPKIANVDYSFISQENILKEFLFPVAMIVSLYLFETSHQLYAVELSKERVIKGMFGTLLSLAITIIALILSIYSERTYIKIIFFFISWIAITALKWVNLRMTEPEKNELIKSNDENL